MSLNKVILIGNVGKDPLVKHLESGTVTASFTLATSEKYKDRNGTLQTNTEWHNIVCWRSLAEIAEKYIRKGSQIYVEGKLQSRSWKDQNDQERNTIEIIASSIVLLGKRPESETGTSGYNTSEREAPSSQKSKPPIVEDYSGEEPDDLPF